MNELQTAVEALSPYLSHKKDCAVREGLGWAACSCGLEPTLAALRQVGTDTRQEPHLCRGCFFDSEICNKYENGECHEQNHFTTQVAQPQTVSREVIQTLVLGKVFAPGCTVDQATDAIHALQLPAPATVPTYAEASDAFWKAYKESKTAKHVSGIQAMYDLLTARGEK